jgi:hypothetical protein
MVSLYSYVSSRNLDFVSSREIMVNGNLEAFRGLQAFRGLHVSQFQYVNGRMTGRFFTMFDDTASYGLSMLFSI